MKPDRWRQAQQSQASSPPDSSRPLRRLLEKCVPDSLAGRTVLIMLTGGALVVMDVVFVSSMLGKQQQTFSDWLVLALVIIVGLLMVAYLVSRQLVVPLRRLTETANRFAVDMDGKPVPEIGPMEVRRTIAAFNRMQSRISRFVTERMQTIGAISHDLRTPITRMRLRVERLQDSEDKLKTLADLDDMGTMITATLAFIRDDAKKEAALWVDFNSLLQTVCDDISDSVGEAVFEAGETAPMWCRPVAMKRAFSNLVENAVRYGLRARVWLKAEADALVVMIQDRGPGIPPSQHELVFAPFHRLEQSRNRNSGGTGLGLTVAASIVQGHGGDIWLENTTEGLLVRVVLPRRSDDHCHDG